MVLNRLTFKEFKLLTIFKDQTEIVTFLLNNEKEVDLPDLIHNQSDVTITFPFEVKTVPSTLFYRLVDQNGEQYRDQLNKLEEGTGVTSPIMEEIERLKEMSFYYEEASFKERIIYEWRLIPHWLADYLINKGETVLKGYGNSWVGIRRLDQSGALYLDFLTEVYNELPP